MNVAIESGGAIVASSNLRLAEAARVAGVCTKTISRWVRAGRLQPAEITPSGEKRYSRADVGRVARLHVKSKDRRASEHRT